MRTLLCAALFVPWAALVVGAAEHPGRAQMEQSGYAGTETCLSCHPDAGRQVVGSVHWTHASKVDNVEGIDKKAEHGMLNRIYTMCNGNDIINDMKEVRSASGKTKFTGCNTCHPGNHIQGVGSKGPAAEKAVDCLLCHSSEYDFRARKGFLDEQGRVVMGRDSSLKAALAVGKPGVNNCMACHEGAGGGQYNKRGFEFRAETDAHAAKGMVCVDCHKGKEHRIPTGFDPNLWANDGLRISCAGCHTEKPHKDEDYNRHTARLACQTCHTPRTGGASAKDFTQWEKQPDGFWEPSTLKHEPNETRAVYAWFNGTVKNEPHLIAPKGDRRDPKSRIFPFKVFEGKAYFDKKTGKLLGMDFAPPMQTGDTLAGVAAAAKIQGIKDYEPVPGWQRIYFANSHLVTKTKALKCADCHSPGGILPFAQLGYSPAEVGRLTSSRAHFEKSLEKQRAEWD
ncbi:MAG: cytochrome C [Elusimicrobiota bacterium]|nr:cytochrome C [Elusimicrobiota bacterium]